MIGIFSKNRAEWSITDMAASLFKLTIIPIYDTLGDENITYVFKHTALTSCFVNDGALKSLMKCQNLVSVTTLICFDKYTEEQKKFF
jgi:long-chain acyl-CoA synthetase